MGPLGWQETVFIFVLALLIFGPKKLPELGKTIGKAMTEFRRASSELRSTWDREMVQLEQHTESLKEETRKIEGEISNSYHDGNSNYDYNNSYYDSGYEYGYGADNSTTASTTGSSTVGATATEGAELTTQTAEGAASPEAAAATANGTESSTATTAVAEATHPAPPAPPQGAGTESAVKA